MSALCQKRTHAPQQKSTLRPGPAVSVQQRPQVLPFLDRQLNERQYSATVRSVRIVERFTHLQVIVVRGFNQFDGLCYWIRPWSTCSPFPLIGFAHSTRKPKLLLRLSAGLLSRSAERRRSGGSIKDRVRDNVSEIARPMALAAFKLTTNSESVASVARAPQPSISSYCRVLRARWGRTWGSH